ncbi:MAG: secretory lipase [Microbacteriaceae bacterium]|nr:secretory lipase [Microbacteriaceae bacterium]
MAEWSNRRTLVVAAVVTLALAASVVTIQQDARRAIVGAIEESTAAAFYSLPDPLPKGKPGTVVRTQRIYSVPIGTTAWRIMYHSTDLFGADEIVSGTLITPMGPTPEGGRTIVSWAHPTTGAAARCAPSVGIDPFDLIEGMDAMLKAGFAVVATDYPGMGAAGPNAYLIGKTAGNSVLDAARAAHSIDTSTSTKVLLWGHSQGGQAVLFAAQDAGSYAPDLTVVAAAVAAPAIDLAVLLGDDINDVSGVTIGSYAFDAFATTYGPTVADARLDTILTPAAAAATPTMAKLCLFGQQAQLHTIARPLIGDFLASDPTKTEPWASLLAENTPGSTRLEMPLFVAQGDIDTLVRPASTAQFVDGECSIGSQVTFLRFAKTGHGLIALRAVRQLMTFFDDALAGRPQQTTC